MTRHGLLLVLVLATAAVDAKYVSGFVEGYMRNIRYFERFVFAPAQDPNWSNPDREAGSGGADGVDEVDINSTAHGKIWLRTYTFMRDHTIMAIDGI